MTEGAFNIFEEEIPVDETKLKRLSDLAKIQLSQQAMVQELTDKLEAAKKELQKTSMDDIPSLMDEIGMSSFKLDSGESVEVVTKITASISKKNQSEAFQWLRDNGHESLIKNDVTINFGKGEEKKATKFVADLEKKKLTYKQKVSVHTQTLGAFVREQLEEGNDIPMDLLGVFEIKQTKISV